jgi:hypothetical protein
VLLGLRVTKQYCIYEMSHQIFRKIRKTTLYFTQNIYKVKVEKGFNGNHFRRQELTIKMVSRQLRFMRFLTCYFSMDNYVSLQQLQSIKKDHGFPTFGTLTCVRWYAETLQIKTSRIFRKKIQK